MIDGCDRGRYLTPFGAASEPSVGLPQSVLASELDSKNRLGSRLGRRDPPLRFRADGVTGAVKTGEENDHLRDRLARPILQDLPDTTPECSLTGRRSPPPNEYHTHDAMNLKAKAV
jgi:hypothetical protein